MKNEIYSPLLVFLLIANLFVLEGCTTASKEDETKASEYEMTIKSNTKGTNQYDGLLQSFQAQATFLNGVVQSAVLQRKGEFLQWDAAKLQSERDRSFQEMSQVTRFFLRFFVPDSDSDDLSKPNSMWKIYLEANGKRYEAKVKKMTEKAPELFRLYPHHDRFSTAYEVSFPVPTANAEHTGLKLTITSSIGSSDLLFEGR